MRATHTQKSILFCSGEIGNCGIGNVFCENERTITYFAVAEDVQRERDTPPEFRVQMRDVSKRVGEPATFDCQIQGQPRPEVYWTKDGQRLPESPRWKFITEDDHYTLLIYEVWSLVSL